MMVSADDILGARILIVDDQEANIMLLEDLLRDVGYTNVSSTLDPEKVCALYLENQYDLILLDLQMPVMDGFQVMEDLNKNGGGGYVPILVITAQPGHKLRALQGGAKDFISKPFDLVEVKTRIHNMLEVRLLYKKLENYNQELEKTVNERTAELRESEARYRSLTELASDWYWEQNADMKFTTVSGPVEEMLGMHNDETGKADGSGPRWDEAERNALRTFIAERRPFLDFVFSRVNPNGTVQHFQVSGEPMFDRICRFTGYRGIVVEVAEKPPAVREG